MAIRGRLRQGPSTFGKKVLAERNIFKPKAVLKLGRLGEVRVRNYPLCKLVTFATLEIQRTEDYLLHEDDEVGLWWLNYTPESRSESVHTSPSGLDMPISQSQIDFGKAWHLIPKAILDAITMTQLVEEPYVWVDSLCLVQNDPEDLRHGTGVMDLIYEQSILCIVAAGWKDANAGLLGVVPGSRGTSQTIAEIEPRLRLAVYTDPCYLLEDTVYNSRAWT
uniref:Heterokaryon incompatibility domain-containing protein n=1 Tax=Bionectria ochroleuca TaxID=29856 RepID=A0A0B7KG54_BIOOC